MATEQALKDEWSNRIREASHPLLPVGAQTKNLLTDVPATQTIDSRKLAGIVAYDPSEFLITAHAGTTIAEIRDRLRVHGQYLPFDPMFADAGSTLGGTVASGLSGPRQMLFGSLRDFVMEVEFIDGTGQLVRGGGKVVKNAAGFDFPKMMVGSYGRLGLLTEVTLKILPEPKAALHWTLPGIGIPDFVRLAAKLLSQPLPIDSIRLQPNGTMTVEFAGPADALTSVVSRAQALLQLLGETTDERDYRASKPADDSLFSSAPYLARIATSPATVEALLTSVGSHMPDARYELHCGGSLLWLAIKDQAMLAEVDSILKNSHSTGIVVRSSLEPGQELADAKEGVLRTLGLAEWRAFSARVQKAMDPNGQFFSF
ncbi:MAG: FAD-binding protein [Planctomycetota bacterium]